MKSLLTTPFKSIAYCALLMSFQVLANFDLPMPPEHIQSPYPDKKVKTLTSAKALLETFDQQGYTLKSVSSQHSLPPIFVGNLPSDLNDLPVNEKTSGFIRLLLPTIELVNNQLLSVRSKLLDLAKQPESKWSKEEKEWVASLMASYDVKSGELDELLLHIDIIPVGMILAQGIDESGWGTSHFAVNGNSLYGEHLPAHGGKYIATPGGHVKVAAFDNLYSGTASYVHNLNTTHAYKELWQLRRQLRKSNQLNGHELVQALSHYSTRGQAYVDNLRTLIQHHNLDSYNNVSLNQQPPQVIQFVNP